MTDRIINDLPSRSIDSEKAEDVKGGRKLKQFGGSHGNAKKKANSKLFIKAGE